MCVCVSVYGCVCVYVCGPQQVFDKKEGLKKDFVCIIDDVCVCRFCVCVFLYEREVKQMEECVCVCVECVQWES